MRPTPTQIDKAKSNAQGVLAQRADLAFAVLVGSRATGTAHKDSDWDIAVKWANNLTGTNRLLAAEQLRQDLRQALQVREDQIDLIDLGEARLAMRALAAEEGTPLTIADDLAWVRFLQNTWAELEDNQWRTQHAA